VKKIIPFLIVATISGPVSATDFGIRQLGPSRPRAAHSIPSPTASPSPFRQGPVDVHSASLLGARFGRITSILRSAAHNRAVGGVANSYHLHGRAIDIARRPGVSHRQIDAALRAAGFHLLESLDEGDHSHFAFGSGAGSRLRAPVTIAQVRELTRWGIVYAPR
jgi:hypothetical protein